MAFRLRKPNQGIAYTLPDLKLPRGVPKGQAQNVKLWHKKARALENIAHRMANHELTRLQLVEKLKSVPKPYNKNDPVPGRNINARDKERNKRIKYNEKVKLQNTKAKAELDAHNRTLDTHKASANQLVHEIHALDRQAAVMAHDSNPGDTENATVRVERKNLSEPAGIHNIKELVEAIFSANKAAHKTEIVNNATAITHKLTYH